LITTQNLTKRFGHIEAVREVTLDVREGDRYGLLGPNGSGKTTLVRMLLGLVYATSGSISVLGEPIPRHVSRVLPEIGALIEEPAAYPHLSGRVNLRLLDAAGPRGSRRTRRRRVDEALEQVGLAGIDRRPVRSYSLGMRQRLGLAAALVRRPRLLILDEPTNGLDPRGIRDIRDLLIGLNDSGVTIFLSSHLLPEVSALCTRIGVLDSGRLVLEEQLAALQEPTGRVLISTDDPERAVAALDGIVERRDGADLVVRSTDPAALNARLVGAGVPVRSLLTQRRSLEEIVLNVTGAGSDQFGGVTPGGTTPREPPAHGGTASRPGRLCSPGLPTAFMECPASGGTTRWPAPSRCRLLSLSGRRGPGGGGPAQAGLTTPSRSPNCTCCRTIRAWGSAASYCSG
jgi:ABC-2 type transport system ATP-binding protein